MSEIKYLSEDELNLFNEFIAKAATGELGEFPARVAPDFKGYFHRNKFLSVKQWGIVTKNMQPKIEREQVDIGSFERITELFDKARKHIKWPAIVLSAGADDTEEPYLIRLSVAGDTALVPGSVNVTEYDGDNVWYGRILKTGALEISPRVLNEENGPENVKVVTDLLREFADDPVGVASRHGRLTGRCCFCHIALKDERSTIVGYGPTCADNYGLPWGKVEHTFEAYEAATPEVKTPPRKINVKRRRVA